MKSKAVFLFPVLVFATIFLHVAHADSFIYTREQLLSMPIPVLADIVLNLQDRISRLTMPDTRPGESLSCRTFQPLKGEFPQAMAQFRDSRSAQDGTLSWPNGKVFMQRDTRSASDRTLFYPNGHVIRMEDTRSATIGTLFWSNGKTLLVRDSRSATDGSVNHSDGSAWLYRDTRSSRDHSRLGGPIDGLSDGNSQLNVRLNDNESVDAKLVVTEQNWRITVSFSSSTQDVVVEECIRF